MVGVPEKPAVIFIFIVTGVINIYVQNMTGKIVCQLEPLIVSCQYILAQEAIDRVVLIVVM